jgi:hypothetical protein
MSIDIYRFSGAAQMQPEEDFNVDQRGRKAMLAM